MPRNNPGATPATVPVGAANIPEGLQPTLALLVKLGSIARHVQEAAGPGGHPFDVNAATTLLADPEVSEWMRAADAGGLLPALRH